jgi:hypothetical protein
MTNDFWVKFLLNKLGHYYEPISPRQESDWVFECWDEEGGYD